MSVTEALFGSDPETKSQQILETASADARSVGFDAAQEEAVQSGAAEVLKTESELWDDLRLAERALEDTKEWANNKMAELQMMATPEWIRMSQIRDQWVIPYRARMAIGSSPIAVPCGQAEHLRQAVAAGKQPTANEAV